MQQNPKISIITPTYNCAQYLARCIESVKSQGYSNFEHIVVDGGSSDGTVQILGQYPHLRWISERDRGEADALNKAIKMTSGELVLWLNADDWLEQGAFEAVVRAIPVYPQAEVFYGKVNLFFQGSSTIRLKAPLAQMSMPELIRWWLTETHPHQPGMYFSRAALDTIGLFDEQLHFSIDYEFWLRLAKYFSFGYIDSILATALIRTECKSAGTEPEQIKSHWKVLLPYVHELSLAEQERYWCDYYEHRAINPLPFESSRIPENDAMYLGLVRFITQPGALDLNSRFCSIFNNQIAQEQVLSLLEKFSSKQVEISKAPKKVKVAEDYAKDMDLTKIAQNSDFATSIRRIFSEHRPTKIIETGTYLGTGTTAVIASTLRELGINNACFYSIEVNPQVYEQARRNIINAGLSNYVNLRLGLSVPRGMLPTVSEIEDTCVHNIEFDDIFVDHRENNRAVLYYQETNFNAAEDDLLGKSLREFDGKPDFVILDSAGHMGFVEFSYLLSKLKSPCIIALDDVYHIKHHKSFSLIKKDPRFTILADSKEKFGFCIAQFTPTPVQSLIEKEVTPSTVVTHGQTLPDYNVKRILWLRTDSIGDNVLGSVTLEPIRQRFPSAEIAVACRPGVTELFEASPFVDKIIPLHHSTQAEVENLRHELASFRADVLFNTAFSRDTFSDGLAQWASAPFSVAFEGDGINSAEGVRNAGNNSYSYLVKDVDPWTPEIEKYQAFSAAIGLNKTALQAPVWIDAASEAAADRLFRDLGIEKGRAVAFIPGAQALPRVYERYAETIAMLHERGYVLLGIGAKHEQLAMQKATRGIDIPVVNLFGMTNLREAAAILSRCALAIGSESGPAHIACAVGTPQVVILGGGHFGRFMPYSKLTSAVVLPVSCTGCNWYCAFENAHCVKDINPLMLRQAVEERLQQPAQEIQQPQIYLSESSVLHKSTLSLYPNMSDRLTSYFERGDVIQMIDGQRVIRYRSSACSETGATSPTVIADRAPSFAS